MKYILFKGILQCLLLLFCICAYHYILKVMCPHNIVLYKQHMDWIGLLLIYENW